MSWVETAAGRVNTEWRIGSENERSKYHSMLSRAHGSPAKCLCNPNDSPVSIRRIDIDRFTLAAFPNRGVEHDPETCAFFDDGRGGGVESRYESAVKRRDDGSLSVSLAVPLGPPRSNVNVDEEEREYRAAAHRPRVVRGKMTLLGLLYLVWEQARLNRWHSSFNGSRTPQRVEYWIESAAVDLHIARGVLADHMLYALPAPSDGQVRRGWARLFAHRDEKKALVVVGELELTGSLEQRWKSVLARYGWKTTLSSELVQRVERSFRRELNASGRIIFLAILRPGRRETGVEHLVLMQTSEEYIPVDSSHELAFARAAVEQERSFYKPLRLDGADRLPDFILTDTQPHTECEVFGRDDADYLERAAEKKKNASLWYWDAVMGPTMPALPAAAQRGAA